MTTDRENGLTTWQRLRALLLAGLIGCATAPAPGASDVTAAAEGSTLRPARLTAALVPVSGNVRGSVDVDSGAEPGTSRATIQLRGAAAGAQHGWQIRAGRCGEGTQVVGPPAAYRAITVRADGTAELSATIPVVLEAGQRYSVVLLRDRTDIDGVIACGNLTDR